MFQSLGAPELLIILAIVVVLFGATRIGDIGKGFGRGIREFRRELVSGARDRAWCQVAEPLQDARAVYERSEYGLLNVGPRVVAVEDSELTSAHVLATLD